MRAQPSVDPVWSQLYETVLNGYVALVQVKTSYCKTLKKMNDQLRYILKIIFITSTAGKIV